MAAKVLLMYIPDEDAAWGLFQNTTPDGVSKVIMVNPDDPKTVAEILGMFSNPNDEGEK